MKVINVRNVHEALPEGIRLLLETGIRCETRNGDVIVSPVPVTTVYSNPRERVLFWSERDANPFFHFYEGLWMLGGRNDVASLTRFVKRMNEFSDDGVTFHGAYGHRWRRAFKLDQIYNIVNNLRENLGCRRQVLQMWSAELDLPNQNSKKDIPCNLAAHFQVNTLGALDMTVFNRSNDIIWGAYGANAVHFSMLQEFIAGMVQIPVGTYYQVSNNYHAYLTTLEPLSKLGDLAAKTEHSKLTNPYETIPLFNMVNRTSMQDWFNDLEMFLSKDRAIGYRDVFFRRVALPMMVTHRAYKEYKGEEKFLQAQGESEKILAPDWRMAVQDWIVTRHTNFLKKKEQ